eukprot:SAG31_NODE_214_length_20084_cov_2.644684_1_plen_136_part_00
MLLHALMLGLGTPATAPPLLPPGARLRDLAAARTPPLLFGTDLVDDSPYPATGDPAACAGGNRSAPGCQPNASYAAIAAGEFNAGNSDFCTYAAAAAAASATDPPRATQVSRGARRSRRQLNATTSLARIPSSRS